MPGTRLFGVSWWKVIKALLLYEIVDVTFVFLTEAAEIVNAQGSAVTKIGIWLARTSTLTQSHVIFNHYKCLQRFQGR